MFKRKQNSRQLQKQKHYPQLQTTKMIQWQDDSTSGLLAGNDTSKKRKEVGNIGYYWI